MSQTKEAAATAGTYEARAYAASGASSGLAPATIRRREPRPQDVQLDVLFCGVCHSDLHQVRNEWQNAMPTVYPVRPGPRDRRPGSEGGQRRPEVQGRRPGGGGLHGRLVPHLRRLPRGPGAVLRAPGDLHLQLARTRTSAASRYGGYSDSLVVDEAFALRVSDRLDPAGAAPLLCAGITTYSPLRHWNVRERTDGRCRGPRRPRAHGREARERVRRPGRRVHDVARQGGGRGPAGRPRRGGLPQRRADAEAPGPLRLHPGHGLGSARPQRLPRPLEARRHLDASGGAGDARCRSASSACSSGGGGSRARSSAASARPRRCSTSARSTASRPTSR